MANTMYNFPSRIKDLREKHGFTQSQLAKKLSITRSAVNSWELGFSAPSTPFIVEIAELFNVTTDYLLGVDVDIKISTAGLGKQEIEVLLNLVATFKSIRQQIVAEEI